MATSRTQTARTARPADQRAERSTNRSSKQSSEQRAVDTRTLMLSALTLLDRLRSSADRLHWLHAGAHAEALLARGWLVRAGRSATAPVPMGPSPEPCWSCEVIAVDAARGECTVRHPILGTLDVAPLALIELARLDPHALLDAMADALDIAPRFATQRHAALVPEHLWFLGEIRIGRTHAMAPVFYLRRGDADITRHASMNAVLMPVLSQLADARFGHEGLVLTAPCPTASWAVDADRIMTG